jgi:AAA domain
MTDRLVVCLSGRIGSGKTSISQVLSAALQWRRSGFGEYVRLQVRERGGDPESRQALQDLGLELVSADPDAFCRAVLEMGDFLPGGTLILDGIRHADIFSRVARLVAPSRAVLFHLAVEDAEATRRVKARTDAADLTRAESHPVESEVVQSLPSSANYVLDGSKPVKEIAAQILDLLGELGVAESRIRAAKASL